MHRGVGIAFGFGNHVLFAFTVWQLFWFLREPSRLPASCGELVGSIRLLAIFFAVPHSCFAPAGRASTTDPAFARCVLRKLFLRCYVPELVVVFANWQSSASRGLAIHGARCDSSFRAAFYASWVALFYSLSLTGLGYQTGWTPWWHWLRGKAITGAEV